MFEDKISRSTWIEGFVLKEKNIEKFSIIITLFTIVMCSFLLILSAKIKVDLYPVPMTLQPLAVLMIAMLCGRNIAVASVSFYLFQGIIGLPVFAYGGGLMYLMGPTGGFLFGFLIASLIVGELADRGWGRFLFKSIFAMLIGMFIIYFFGITQLSTIKGFDFAIINGLKPFIIAKSKPFIVLNCTIPKK